MSSVNRATILGHLGADPDVRHTESGVCVTSASIATSRKYKNNNGDTVEETEWHRVVFWSKLAEIVEKYLKKGSQVYVEGRLQTRKWTDKDNIDRYTTEIVAQNMTMLGGSSGNSGGGVPHPAEVSDEEVPDLPF